MSLETITTYQGAIDYIQANPSITVSELQQLTRQMQTSEAGKATLLYNNSVLLKNGETVQTWKIAESIGEHNADVFKTFNQTEAGKLFNSTLFDQKLSSLVSQTEAEAIRSGLISDISLNLAETASGSVWTMTGGTRALDAIDTSSDYFQNELPALLRNIDVTDIKGGQYGLC